MAYGYHIALFDVLGFERRLTAIGLAEMLARYEALIAAVNYRKEHIRHVFGDMAFQEAPYWTAEGDVMIFSMTSGAYASDSILVWANRTWPAARGKSPQEIERLSTDRARGWAFHPIPCDNFLDVCNDLVCHGLEVGLPLRGALAIGEAVLDESRSIFLGQPIIEAARLERGQRLIGASICKSFAHQTIPKRFMLEYDGHLKDGYRERWGGFTLDWPRHWRKTRSSDPAAIVKALDTTAAFSEYYENTRKLIEQSARFADQFESTEDTSIRSLYPQFSYSNKELAVHGRAVRRVPIQS